MPVLDQHFFPFSLTLVVAIEAFKHEAFATLRVLGRHVIHVQTAANLPAVQRLPDGVLGQRRGVDDVVQSTFHKPHKGGETVGYNFGRQFLAQLLGLASKGYAGLLANAGQHVDESFL